MSDGCLLVWGCWQVCNSQLETAFGQLSLRLLLSTLHQMLQSCTR